MKRMHRYQLLALLRLTFHEFFYLCRKAAGILARTPLPRLLVAGIALALLLTILPLALSLFALFLLLKILLFCVVMAVRRTRRRPGQLEHARRVYGQE
ncbi:MAG: hypothetical protein HYZ65_03100 [Burkholderiales bacterium]|nr:hypothetical protein [Burkholderiales bacterium]